MKPKSFLRLEFEARLNGIRARNLWAAQGGMAASMNRQPGNRLAEAARALADQRAAEAEFFQSLGRLFPCGLGWHRPSRAWLNAQAAA